MNVVGLLLIVLVAPPGLRDARRDFEYAFCPGGIGWLNAAKAQGMADAECAKYSRVALMRLRADLDKTTYVFEYVAP